MTSTIVSSPELSLDVLQEEKKKEWRRRLSQAKKVKKPMTLEKSRKLYPAIRPFLVKNGEVIAESIFGGTKRLDGGPIIGDIALLKSGDGAPCTMCTAPTENIYLHDGTCPDCDGRSEANGADPRRVPQK